MKRFISLILVLILLTASLPCAASGNSDTRFGVLKAFDIMQGYENGDLGLDRYVTRAEFTKMTIAASQYRNAVAATLSVSPFPDVTFKMWHAPYVYIGVSNNLLAGYKDGTFKPDNHVLYEEAVTILLRLLGYQDSEFAYSWPVGQISMAEKIGLCDNVSAFVGQPLTRDQVSHLFYNLLTSDAKTQSGSASYVSLLDQSVMSDTVLISSYLQSDAVKKGYVNTSAGLYEVADDFDYSLVGLKGDAVIKDKKMIAFIPESSDKTVYNVFSVSGNNLILFKDGRISDYKLDNDEILYYDGTKTTVSAMLHSFSPGDVIEIHYDENREVEYVTYSETSLTGPVVIKSADWYTSAGINQNASVVRNGEISGMDALELYDVIYYSKELQNVWATDNKITGVYSDAFPNTDQVSQVQVSGSIYDLNSVEAFKKLSSGGVCQLGDIVTLLLDRDGRVADVLTGNDQSGEITGFMLYGGLGQFTNSKNETYSSPYVTILKSDGTTEEYESRQNYSENYKGAMVDLSFQDSKAVLTEATGESVYGTFDNKKKTFGSLSFDQSIEIVDIVRGDLTSASVYTRIYPQRLDGIYIPASKVLYAKTNSSGKITALFLNNVSGDAFSYGLVTKAESQSGGMNVSGSYTYFDKSSLKSTRTSGKSFVVSAGSPVQIKNTSAGVEQMTRLSSLGTVTEASGVTMKINGKTYTYTNDISIYYFDGSEYQSVPFERLCELIKTKSVTSYSERTDDIAKIRVIVIK